MRKAINGLVAIVEGQMYLQTDAYEGYGAVCRENDLISVGCLAHARRKFDEALKAQSSVDPNKQKSTLAAQALKQIQALYSLVETAQVNGHEPYAYIKQVLKELPAATTLEDVEALLPFKLQPAEYKAA